MLFDRASYRIRENLDLKYILANNSFDTLLNSYLILSVPDIGYTYSGTLAIEPGKSIEIPFSIPIPETAASGQHQILTSLTLPSGVVYQNAFNFTIPESNLLIKGPEANSFIAGDVINLRIKNTGGIDLSYISEEMTIADNKGIKLYEGSISGIVRAGEEMPFSLHVPSQAVSGTARLTIRLRDNNTQQLQSFADLLEVTGPAADLKTNTDKGIYLAAENLTGLTLLANGDFGINNGSLKLKVINPSPAGAFSRFPSGTPDYFHVAMAVAVSQDDSIYIGDYFNGIVKFDDNWNFIAAWGGFHGIGDVTVSSDNAVYVLDDNQVKKYDSNGNFITKWGGYGHDNGQFNAPYGIATGGGFVFVSDADHRIQKFDSGGDFITKWGNFCKTDENGDGLPDQECNGGFYSPMGSPSGTTALCILRIPAIEESRNSTVTATLLPSGAVTASIMASF
jgi:hypothetical protein